MKVVLACEEAWGFSVRAPYSLKRNFFTPKL